MDFAINSTINTTIITSINSTINSTNITTVTFNNNPHNFNLILKHNTVYQHSTTSVMVFHTGKHKQLPKSDQTNV